MAIDREQCYLQDPNDPAWRVPLDYFTAHPKFQPFLRPWTTTELVAVNAGGTKLTKVVMNKDTGYVHIPGTSEPEPDPGGGA